LDLGVNLGRRARWIRSIAMRNGELTDEFKPYEVHLYELRRAK
jgi:hypothetical protein